MIKYFTFAVLFILVLYGLREAWPLVAGPALSIESPADNKSSESTIVTVSGTAVRAATLTLNGSPLIREENGSFATILTLPRGGSILTFEAADRFGRTNNQTRAIFIP